MSVLHVHAVAPREAALLARAGYPLPETMRLAMGTRLARWIGWLVRQFDAPPAAVTLGHIVYIPDAAAFQRLPLDERAALLAHEAVHIRQWEGMGGGQFLWLYLREYVRARREGVGTHDARRGIALEREALAVENRLRKVLQTLVQGENLV